ncbi:MAG: tetratricopeptide repeat protein [Anaerolineae bacterium]
MPYSALEMADAFIKAGELQDALDVLNQYLEGSADDDAYRLRVELLLRLSGDGPLHKALADLKALSAPTPDDEMRRSVIFERLGEWETALAAAQNAYQARPDDERFAERTLQLLLTQGKLDDAAALLASLPQTWRWQQWRGDVAAARAEWQTARAEYEAALEALEQGSAFVWVAAVKARLHLALAEVCIHLADYPQAESHYHAAEALVTDDPMIAFNRGLLAALQGDTDAAISLCAAAYGKANAALREVMVRTLGEDVRYQEIANALES